MKDWICNARHRVVGTKQTLKALEKGGVTHVFVARDAEEKVVKPVVTLCEKCDVKLHYVETMFELGRMCGIKVKAAAAAITDH